MNVERLNGILGTLKQYRYDLSVGDRDGRNNNLVYKLTEQIKDLESLLSSEPDTDVETVRERLEAGWGLSDALGNPTLANTSLRESRVEALACLDRLQLKAQGEKPLAEHSLIRAVNGLRHWSLVYDDRCDKVFQAWPEGKIGSSSVYGDTLDEALKKLLEGK